MFRAIPLRILIRFAHRFESFQLFVRSQNIKTAIFRSKQVGHNTIYYTIADAAVQG